MAEAEEDARKAREAMAATATKLHSGISTPTTGDIASGTFAATDRVGSYNTAATAILVSIGDGTSTPTAAATLSED